MSKIFPHHDEKDLAEAIETLAQAIVILSNEKKTEFEWLKSHLQLATKQDLKETEERLIKAMGERVDVDAVKGLTKASDKLESAVEHNQK